MTNEHENGLEWHVERLQFLEKLMELMADGMLLYTPERMEEVRETWGTVLLASVCPALTEIREAIQAVMQDERKKN